MVLYPQSPPASACPAHGLKEWAVICEALLSGAQSLLLRKGGIDEPGGRFEPPAASFWLLPTYEHQRPELLRPPWDARCAPRPAGGGAAGVAPAPAGFRVPGWAEVVEVHRVADEAALERLADLHIFSAGYAGQRLRWKPSQPLWVLALRVHRLDAVLEVPWHPSYAGCTSLVELEAAVPSPSGGRPVLPEPRLAALRTGLAQRLGAPAAATGT
jgi:hypothetical protein